MTMKFSPTLVAVAAAGAVVGALAVGVATSGGDGPAVEARGGAAASPGAGNPRGGRSRGGGRGGYAPVVSMAVAEQAAVARTIDVIGRARALRSVAITSEATGIVETVNIAPGKRVSEGDLLLQIVDDEQQVALNRARAEYPIARENAERYRNLESDAAASALEAEQAQTNYVSAQAQLRAAEVAVEQRRIVAPFDGVAGLTDIEPGDYLRAGDVVTTLDDTSSIIVEFAVPQEAAAFVNVGQDVRAAITSAANISYDGVITAIDSRVDSVSRTLRVEAQVENDNSRLIPGAVLAVTTTADGEPAIAVPGLAIQWDRSGAYVWRRGRGDTAERAGVVILQRTDETVLVEGELQLGDAIVAEGADRVRAGVPLPAGPAQRGGGGVGAAGGMD
jgi:RND family efflux transporter MFP subunit